MWQFCYSYLMDPVPLNPLSAERAGGADLRLPQVDAARLTPLLIDVLAASWSAVTSSDPNNWSPDNPAWGQCAVTACIAQDLLGGDIRWAEAVLPDGRTISHYFNVLDSGGVQDFTARQFPAGTIIPEGEPKTRGLPSTRDYVLSYPATRERYLILRDRVFEKLAANPDVRG
jgi:hypothetical protein